MAKKSATSLFFKRLLNQLSGEVDESEELIPEYAIKGKGIIWCWDPNSREHKPIPRGIKVYIVYKNYDHLGRFLVYTVHGELICIDEEEIYYTGFN